MNSILFTTFLLALRRAFAQTTTATCLAGYEWTLNDLQQSPCLVAAFLGHQCSPNITFNVPPILSTQQYVPPSGDQINGCECSSVYFSLLSACSICQGSSLGDFTKWTQGCPQGDISMEAYPQPVPSGTHIQTWAYLPLNEGVFDVNAAGRNATGNSSSGSSSGPSKGAIIGLAVGSSVAFLLICIAVFVFWRAKNAQPRHRLIGSESHTSIDHSGFHYVEGPPRRPYHWLLRRTPQVVSYRPGLNFDLNNGQRGDLVELSESNKPLKNQLASKESNPGSAWASRTSLESSIRLPKKRDMPRASNETPALPSKMFSRAKEIKSRPNASFDLVAGGANVPSDGSRDPSPARPAILDM